ncbi:MAG: glycosyltransferase family 4 protein [Erysipelotrichaceae bacterium]|nr:glycosyltransferase family 4 protein [Erysipelotrichaceae bacterium]
MKILQVCAFGAPNAGNFIASLLVLENNLKNKGFETIYAFAETAKNKKWCQQICKTHKVYFLPVAKARILPKTYLIFKKIYDENDIQIAHSHFELYDIPCTITAPKGVTVFWHLHDPILDNLSGSRGLLNKIQYGIVGKKANLISVSEYYRKQAVKLGFPKEKTVTILNGISLERINFVNNDIKIKKEYTFLTFGWDYYRKGVDLILSVCDTLYKEGYLFKLLLNGNEKTWSYVNDYYNENLPSYIECGEPVDDINILYSNTSSFIQASRKETFSYAVCEAAYAGLPVISSNINGLEWAHDLPTVHFFENEDVVGLYECMKSIIEKQWQLESQEIMTTRNTIINNFSLKVWSENIMNCYFK